SLKKNAPPHLKGTSAVQFIMTSSLIIHALDDLKTLYMNVFSCDDFDEHVVSVFIRHYFEGSIVAKHVITRGDY
ncbi:MAG: S-adenosylmethionine decarboxylase, partial [Bacteroidetes bacterium]|nr:S-adenosylmethionine decarboxylase [Bacteroidota bacterium]